MKDTAPLKAAFLSYIEDIEDDYRFKRVYGEVEKFLGLPTLETINREVDDQIISPAEAEQLIKANHTKATSFLLDLLQHLTLPAAKNLEQEFVLARSIYSLKQEIARF